jgi:hypothetical protein
MKKKNKYVLIIILIVLCLFIVKILFFLIAKPKIVVDYPAKINALSKPSDYDPNKDGFQYLIKASELYMEKPAGAELAPWPNEMNDTEMSLLRQWMADNSEAFDSYKKAGESDYIWIEHKRNYESNKRDLSKWPWNEFDLYWCLLENAKLKAFEGNFNETLDYLLAAWKVAAKKANPNYALRWQMDSLSDRRNVLDIAIDIVDVYRPSAGDLEKWQKQWQKQFESDSYVPGLEGERLDCYDEIQREFVHKSNGSGRLYWRSLKKFDVHYPCSGSESILNLLLLPITGPTESDIRKRVDYRIARYKEIVTQPPWDLRYPEQKYVQAQEEYKKDNRMWEILDSFIPSLHTFTIFYHRVKMRQDALVTILAILRFNSQNGHYPSNLDELVKKGFLTELPRDPFSQGPLFYNKLGDDDFELYSVGPDFIDDGGKIYQGGNPLRGADYGDEVFWPPFRKGRKNVKFITTKELGLK